MRTCTHLSMHTIAHVGPHTRLPTHLLAVMISRRIITTVPTRALSTSAISPPPLVVHAALFLLAATAVALSFRAAELRV